MDRALDRAFERALGRGPFPTTMDMMPMMPGMLPTTASDMMFTALGGTHPMDIIEKVSF